MDSQRCASATNRPPRQALRDGLRLTETAQISFHQQALLHEQSAPAPFSMNLQSDPFGRLDKVPRPRRALQPLFEAISNSLHSVRRRSDGPPSIRILLDRDQRQQQIVDSAPSTSILRITVEDNGEGFTDANCQSFQNTDSRHKKQVGGKGIGRLLWIKTFKHVEISSVFASGSGRRRRSWVFKMPETGDNFIPSVSEEDCNPSTPVKTTVSLVSPLSVLRRTTEDMAYEIIAHFLTSFTARPGNEELSPKYS